MENVILTKTLRIDISDVTLTALIISQHIFRWGLLWPLQEQLTALAGERPLWHTWLISPCKTLQ